MKITDQELQKLAENFSPNDESLHNVWLRYGFKQGYRQAEADTIRKVLDLLRNATEESDPELMTNFEMDMRYKENVCTWLESEWGKELKGQPDGVVSTIKDDAST